jgi:2-polyprenyl-3-methyl-5-hydroxy-6-metoxy-1,4-benzoquinol methylase
MPGLNDLGEFRRGAEWALALATALELGLVEALAEGIASTGELAARLSLDPRGVEALLGALAGLGAVRDEPGGWLLTGAARARLVDADAPDYEGESLRHWLRNVRRWAADLPEVVRHGRAPGADGPERAAPTRDDLASFMAAMANRSPAIVEAVAGRIRSLAPGARTLLDVGGGPGAYARALAGRGLRVTLYDRPEVIEHVAEVYGLASEPGIELVAGDFLESLPPGPFDVALLANVTHIYGPAANAELIRRCAGALAPGGRLAVLDFVRGISDFAPLFALTMLLSTQRGGTWSLREYAGWMQDAGLAGVRCASVGPDAQLVTAVRAGSDGSEATA